MRHHRIVDVFERLDHDSESGIVFRCLQVSEHTDVLIIRGTLQVQAHWPVQNTQCCGVIQPSAMGLRFTTRSEEQQLEEHHPFQLPHYCAPAMGSFISRTSSVCMCQGTLSVDISGCLRRKSSEYVGAPGSNFLVTNKACCSAALSCMPALR